MQKRAFWLWSLPVAALVLAAAASSCLEGADIALGDCLHPDFGHFNRNGDLDPCCIDQTNPCNIDSGDASAPTPGCGGNNICVPLTTGSDDFEPVPELLWYGDAGQMPACPENAQAGATLHRDPLVVNTCPLCACGDPACVLPVGVVASSANADCTGPSFTNFAAKADGSCNSPGKLPPNAVKSLSIQAPTVSGCAPKADLPKDVKGTVWGKDGLVCRGLGNGFCPDPENQACVPRPPEAPPGFRLCVETRGHGDESSECPDGYPNRVTLYNGVDYKVSCTDCACDAPMGSTCVAAVSAFTDELCSSPVFKDYLVSNAPPPFPCASLQPNVALQGISEKWVVDEPGKCAPIDSVPTGKVDVDHGTAHTFCCQGEPFDL